MYTNLKSNKLRLLLLRSFLLLWYCSGLINYSLAVYNTSNLDKIHISREKYLSEIKKIFDKEENIVVLVGGSGIGKTQSAKEYAGEYSELYDVVWWFNYNEDFLDQLKQFAVSLNNSGHLKTPINLNLISPEYIAFQIKETVRNTDKKWLLIYDDVADYDEIKSFIFDNKKIGNVHTIITSKNELCWKERIKIKKFEREESKKLLKEITKLEDEAGFEELADLLGDYPLAISQAATFIRVTGMSNCSEYISKFKTERKILWRKEENVYNQHSQLHDQHNTILTTMKISLENLKKKSTSAYRLYKCMGLLYKKNIYHALVKQIYSSLNGNSRAEENEVQFQNDINLIISEGLLDRSSSEGEIVFSIHEMLQYALDELINAEERKQFLSVIAAAIAKFSDGYWDDLVEYVSKNPGWNLQAENLIALAEKVGFVNEDLIKVKIRILEYNIYHLREHKLYEQQVHELNRMIQTYPISPKEKARFYIDSVYDRTIYENGRVDDMEKNIKWAVEFFRSMEDTKEYFRSLIKIANFYFFLNQMDQALFYLNQASNLLRGIQSQSYKNMFYYINGWILYESGKWHDAYEQVTLFLNNFETHTNASIRLLVLALGAECLLAFGDIEKATTFANTVIEDAKKLYQHEKSEVTALSTMVLAECCKLKNNLSKAEELARKAIDIYRDYFGGNYRHPDQANAYILLGDIYKMKKFYGSANAEYSEAEKIFDTISQVKKSIKISKLYQKMFSLSIEMHDEENALRYFNKHKDIFGLHDNITLEMAKDLRI